MRGGCSTQQVGKSGQCLISNAFLPLTVKAGLVVATVLVHFTKRLHSISDEIPDVPPHKHHNQRFTWH